MKLTLVFGSIAIAFFFTISSVSASRMDHNPTGTWYVVGINKESKLDPKCWYISISNPESEWGGNYTSHYTNQAGEEKLKSERYHDFFPHINDSPLLHVGAKYLEVNFEDENTMKVKGKGLPHRLKYMYLSHDPSHKNFSPTHAVKEINNSCA